MSKPLSVYIFSCRNPEFHGFSFRRDAGNLPNRTDCPHPWTLLKAVTLDEFRNLGLAFDAHTAIASLKTRGYYIARTTAAVLEFPRPHRRSA